MYQTQHCLSAVMIWFVIFTNKPIHYDHLPNMLLVLHKEAYRLYQNIKGGEMKANEQHCFCTV